MVADHVLKQPNQIQQGVKSGGSGRDDDSDGGSNGGSHGGSYLTTVRVHLRDSMPKNLVK